MNPLIIYNDNCADGFGAAFAAWLKLGYAAEYLPMQLGKPFAAYVDGELRCTHEINDREIYILNFSFPRPIMEALFSAAGRVVWLDHHKTAFEMWCGGIPSNGVFENVLEMADAKDYIRLDTKRSGALLAWMYFHPETEVPMLIRHIDDRVIL